MNACHTLGAILRNLYSYCQSSQKAQKGRYDTDEETEQWQHQNFYTEGGSEVAKYAKE